MIYKVFHKYGSELRSVCQNGWFPESYRVTYDRDKVNYPRVLRTRLFVFDSLKNAESFRGSMGICNTEVWSCEGVDLKVCEAICGPSNVEIYWEKIDKGLFVTKHDRYSETISFNDGSTLGSVNLTPKGAYTCSMLKLIEKLS